MAEKNGCSPLAQMRFGLLTVPKSLYGPSIYAIPWAKIGVYSALCEKNAYNGAVCMGGNGRV